MSNDSANQSGMKENEKWQHTGAILTGGLSTRMGQAKHEMILPDGRTMFHAVLDVMSEVCSHVVVLAGKNDGDDEKTGNENYEGLQVVYDLRNDCGPLGGIEALLTSGVDSEYLICPCDVPLISADILRTLVLNKEGGSIAATVIKFENDDAVQSLPLKINAVSLDDVKQQLDEGKRAIHQLLKRIDVQEMSMNENARPRIKNINTQQEFEEVCKQVARLSEPRIGGQNEPRT